MDLRTLLAFGTGVGIEIGARDLAVTLSHVRPNGVRVAPKKTAEIVGKFTKSGTFEYSCLIPNHREYGMTGHVLVK